MVYRRSRVNVRRAPKRRAPARRRSSYTRPRQSTNRRQRGSKKQCICPGELTPSAKFALAQLDPFHPNSLGAKIPDSNTMPSIANCSTDQVACPVATTGFLTGFAFRPTYNSAVIVATPASVSTVTWGLTISANASDRRDASSFKDQMEAVRPVAHAVRLVSSLSPTAATGFVHIGLSVESYYNAPSSSWQFPTTVNEMTGLAFYKRITLASLTQSPITAINKWLDDRGFQYQDPSQTIQMAAAAGNEIISPFGFSWSNIVVLVEGAPATGTPLSAEHLLLSEALPKKTSIIIGTQAAANSPGTLSAVSSMAAEQEFTHTEAQQDSYMQQGVSAFTRGAAVAGEQVFNNVAIPLLQRVGQYGGTTAARYAMNAITGRGGLPGVNSNPGRLSLT